MGLEELMLRFALANFYDTLCLFAMVLSLELINCLFILITIEKCLDKTL